MGDYRFVLTRVGVRPANRMYAMYVFEFLVPKRRKEMTHGVPDTLEQACRRNRFVLSIKHAWNGAQILPLRIYLYYRFT